MRAYKILFIFFFLTLISVAGVTAYLFLNNQRVNQQLLNLSQTQVGNVTLGNDQKIMVEDAQGKENEVLYTSDDQAIRLKSTAAALFVNPDSTTDTLINYNNSGNIILGYEPKGWNGKVGIGTSNPAWALDVFGSFSPQGGVGGLTPQLSHYNAQRVQQNIEVKSDLRFADMEALYGVTNYFANGNTTDSYLVGIHGDVYATGSGNIGPQMITGLWGTATYDGTASAVNMLMGVRGEITVNSGSGVDLASLYAAKPELNGGETRNAFGLFIEDMSGMSIKRAGYPYAIYSVGDIPSYFAGRIGIGTNNPLAALDVRSVAGMRVGGSESKYFSFFTAGAGNDLNTVGGDMFIEFDRGNAVDILNGTLRINPNGGIVMNNGVALWLKDTGGNAKLMLSGDADNAVRLKSIGGSIFINPDILSETTVNYNNDANVILGYRANGWAGKVGIGTTSPASSLDVYSEAGMRVGGSASKYLSFYTSGVGSDINSVGGDLFLEFDKSNAVDILDGTLHVTNDDKIGIGTTDPVVALDIANNTGIRIGNEIKRISIYADGEGTDISSFGGTLYLNYDQLQPVNIHNGQVFFNTDGKVGIGTTSPGAALEIAGQLKITGGSPGANKVLTSDADGLASWQALSNFAVDSVANSDGTLTISPTTGNVVASLNLSHANSWIAAQTFSANTLFPGNGVWNTSGFVGIGTTSPNNPLQVDNVAGIRSGSNTKYIDIFTSGGGNDINSSHTLHLNYGNNQAVSIGEGGVSNLYVSGKLGIGNANPQGALDVTSTTGGLIVPRMTTIQRDALTPVNGMVVYNTTTGQFNFYESDAWVTK